MSQTNIRPAALTDLDAVEGLENIVFDGDRLSRRSLRYYITAPTASFFVIGPRTLVAGDAIVAFRKGSAVARLYSIAVHPDQAGQGLGRRLLAACEAEAVARGRQALRLEVRRDNAAAIALYASAGYRQFGQFEDFYEDGETALRFEKPLAGDRDRRSR